jgi:hypothetical protein
MSTSSYTGKDTESGLDYFGARYYGSTIGHFMSPNPSGLLGSESGRPAKLEHVRICSQQSAEQYRSGRLGLGVANDAGNGVETMDRDSNSGERGSNGGTWAPGYVDENWATFNQRTQMFQVGSVGGAGNYATVAYTNFEYGTAIRIPIAGLTSAADRQHDETIWRQRND